MILYKIIEPSLKSLRLERGLLQKEVAEMIGVTFQAYSRFEIKVETGQTFHEKTFMKVKALEDIYGCEFKYETSKPYDYRADKAFKAAKKKMEQNIREWDAYYFRKFKIEQGFQPKEVPKCCERCNYRRGQTCLVPTCMKVDYVPRDYGVFKSEVS